MRFRNVLIRYFSFMAFLMAVGVEHSVTAQTQCTGQGVLTAKSCAGDATSADEEALLQIVNKYRAETGLPAVKLSSSLSMVGNRHLIDLIQNVKFFTHGWSNCPYDFNVEKTWPCVGDAPVRLNSGYKGEGFETLYKTAKGNATPDAALAAWKKSTLHNSIILNLDMFKDRTWDEVGVAISGPYAALWFGAPVSKIAAATNLKGIGLGVSYDDAVKGLSALLSIDKTSLTADNNKWQGFTADKKTKLEIFGTQKDISEASVSISMKLGPDGKLTAENQKILVTLLGNCFPEWPNIDAWVTSSVAAISADRSAMRAKLVRKNTIEFSSNALNSLLLRIQPESKQKYQEF